MDVFFSIKGPKDPFCFSLKMFSFFVALIVKIPLPRKDNFNDIICHIITVNKNFYIDKKMNIVKEFNSHSVSCIYWVWENNLLSLGLHVLRLNSPLSGLKTHWIPNSAYTSIAKIRLILASFRGLQRLVGNKCFWIRGRCCQVYTLKALIQGTQICPHLR